MSFIKYTRTPRIAAALQTDSWTILVSISQQIPRLCTRMTLEKLETASKKTEFLSQNFDMPLSRIEWTTKQDTTRKRTLKEKLHGEKEERKALKRSLAEFLSK